MKQLIVYLAGSSHPEEMKRVKHWAQKCRDAGITVTSTWIENIAMVGSANPRDADRYDRIEWSIGCLRQVAHSHGVWFLVPPVDRPTRGAWLEIGHARANGLRIVSSGDTKQSIFTALGVEYETDDKALADLINWAEQVQL